LAELLDFKIYCIRTVVADRKHFSKFGKAQVNALERGEHIASQVIDSKVHCFIWKLKRKNLATPPTRLAISIWISGLLYYSILTQHFFTGAVAPLCSTKIDTCLMCRTISHINHKSMQWEVK